MGPGPFTHNPDNQLIQKIVTQDDYPNPKPTLTNTSPLNPSKKLDLERSFTPTLETNPGDRASEKKEAHNLTSNDQPPPPPNSPRTLSIPSQNQPKRKATPSKSPNPQSIPSPNLQKRKATRAVPEHLDDHEPDYSKAPVAEATYFDPETVTIVPHSCLEVYLHNKRVKNLNNAPNGLIRGSTNLYKSVECEAFSRLVARSNEICSEEEGITKPPPPSR